jgi:uncharacterized membrane protein
MQNPKSIKTKKSNLLRAALMGIMAASTATLLMTPQVAAQSKAKDSEKVNCYGVNKCKGTGDCGGKTHSCAGQNKCQGKGWLKLDKDTCLKIQGGSLKPVEG